MIDALRKDNDVPSTTPLEENEESVSPGAPPAADFVNAAGGVKDCDGGNSTKEPTTKGRKEGRRRVFEFYPFLNDAMNNEMDGEARCALRRRRELFYPWYRVFKRECNM